MPQGLCSNDLGLRNVCYALGGETRFAIAHVPEMRPMQHDEAEPYLSKEEEGALLRIARSTLETFVSTGETIQLSSFELTDTLRLERCAFVTLRKREELRGCIGSTNNTKALALSVRDNTVGSSAHDPRFEPVAVGELADIHIEISALTGGDEPGSPFRRLKDIGEIVLGRDGLFVRRPNQRGGLLLPQVPLDQGWDVEQYLRELCRKARYDENAWQEPDVELYRFSAQVFGES